MPERQLTIATYAAGASLAAITLVYVFGPTFFIDGDSATTSASSRKKTIVGLSNPANDCFINSVLQALAGLGDLRAYLIRETHRRALDGSAVYKELVEDPARKGLPSWKIEGLQEGKVTHGLKDILDALNERPIYKKTISASSFVQVLEDAFKQRISRQQQDAQEFLQVVAERLCDEYHAGHRARGHARSSTGTGIEESSWDVGPASSFNTPGLKSTQTKGIASASHIENCEREDIIGKESGFPLEGVSESQIECETCGFKPRPTTSTFSSLTLSVPQVSSTSLSSCFDQMFKTEFIEDFKCEKCRLVHALETYEQEYARSTSDKFKATTMKSIKRIRDAIETNPEEELEEVELPDSKYAPKRKIKKYVRITKFPKIMAIHLSRSVYENRATMKNSAKVVFPERLPLGGILDQKFYKLSSVTCHKGSHNSGHYETFRRQIVKEPFSTHNAFQPSPAYSKHPTPLHSQISTPQLGLATRQEDVTVMESNISTPELLSPSSAASSSPPMSVMNGAIVGEPFNGTGPSTSNSASSGAVARNMGPTSAPRDPETASVRSMARSARSTISSKLSISRPTKTSPPKRKKVRTNRWWRISDDKVKESKTADVLGMQREVYLLFYEIDDTECSA